MKNQILKQNFNHNLRIEELTEEDITEIHTVVEALLATIEKKKQQKVKKPRSRKKWEKKVRKSKEPTDLGIRELPFTF